MAKQITMVLIDLSGTLHIDNIVIPGAIQALNRCNFLIFLDCECIVHVHILQRNRCIDGA